MPVNEQARFRLALSGVSTSVHDPAVQLRRVVYDQVNEAVDQMQQLVDDNTR